MLAFMRAGTNSLGDGRQGLSHKTQVVTIMLLPPKNSPALVCYLVALVNTQYIRSTVAIVYKYAGQCT